MTTLRTRGRVVDEFIERVAGPRPQTPPAPVELVPVPTVERAPEASTTPVLPQPTADGEDPIERFVQAVQEGKLKPLHRRRLPSVRVPQPQPAHVTRAVELIGLLSILVALWWVWAPLALVAGGVAAVLWAQGERADTRAELNARALAEQVRRIQP